MLKHFIALSGIVLLSGCVPSKATQQETQQYRTESMQAVKSSEENLSKQIGDVSTSIDQQNAQIEKLQQQILVMSTRVNNLAKHNARALLEFQSQSQTKKEPEKPKQLPPNDNLVVLGSIETVHFKEINKSFEARIDTGAATSSLNATDIHKFERDGKKWVKFNISEETSTDKPAEGTDETAQKEPIIVEAPFIRWAKVRQSNATESHRRPVVELWISLGDVRQKAQFTLTDRSHMSHPVLLGREFIKDIALVDVSKVFIQTEKLQ
ncbi:hypothetical protein VHA01S_044_00030 [Vibrio halioticoli NBRC 102217]|uniref:Retropepsin-like aspartic endopeptidase domain-containing protein n=1 Tax=Vibrio halioticoli NBRC 102217 TaxID=1219072 RepID=V5FLB6_9VIBR|nr:ATP-dependent zinc protease [Vibrio halioticoli]GAD90451.1 hypothetical protein VHA01S_044_00030 [Vibrio halioticoli NBRC 102217]